LHVIPNFFVSLQRQTIKTLWNMIKETYTMEIDIEFEFDDTQIDAVDATDLLDYFATANVSLNDERVNVLNVKLTPRN
jgi:hypothetical protein